MKILKEITEQSLGIGEAEKLGHDYELRKSARAIVLNSDGNMATQYLGRDNFHKLPGGGVDSGESVEEALYREVKEEVGCDIEVTRELGMVIEYRNKYNLLHISYGFVGNVVGEVGTPKLEEDEVAEQMETQWLKPEVALHEMKNDSPERFEGHFILAREIAFLEEFLSQ